MKSHLDRLASRPILVAFAIAAALVGLTAPSPATSGAWFTAKKSTTGSVSSATLGAPSNFTTSVQSSGDTRLKWDSSMGQTWATANSVTSGVSYTVTRTFDGSTTTEYSGSDNTYTDPTFKPQPEKYVQVAAGERHTVARAQDGTVWTWGKNNVGQYGNGTTTAGSSPVQVPLPLRAAVQVEAGFDFSLALLDDGTVWAWGYNHQGQLGDGTTSDRLKAVQVKFPQGTFIKALGDLDQMTSSAYAIASDDNLWAWGANNQGQLGDGTTTVRTAPVAITNFRVKGVASGGTHALAVGIDNALWAWGYNKYGQVGDGTTANRNRPVRVPGDFTVTQVAAGDVFSLAVDTNGAVRAWGANDVGQLGLGFKSNNTVAPRKVPLPDVALSKVTAGRNNACVLAVNAAVYCWGGNYGGVLGDGSTTDQMSAVRNTYFQGQNVTDLAIGDGSAWALVAKGSDTTLYGWGVNDSGQLGAGFVSPDARPTITTSPVVEALRCIPGTTPSGATCEPNSPVTYTLQYTYLAWSSPTATTER